MMTIIHETRRVMHRKTKKEGTNERRKEKAPMMDGMSGQMYKIQRGQKGGKTPSFHAQQSKDPHMKLRDELNAGIHPITHKTRPQKSSIVRPTRQGRRCCCCRCDMHSYDRQDIVKCTFYDERSMNTTMNSCDTTCRPRSVSISAIRFGCANCRLGIILRGR